MLPTRWMLRALCLGVLATTACNQAFGDSPKMFTVGDFNGAYGYQGTREFSKVVLGQVVADGMGNSVDTRVAADANKTTTDTLHCTYTVSPNGTGTENCTSSTNQSMTSSPFVLVAGGAEIYRAALLDGNVSTMLIGKHQ